MKQKLSFQQMLAGGAFRPDLANQTEVRWWMASGRHTNETILQELHAMHKAGFGGVELCQLADRDVDERVYGYGSAQWENDVKLILNTALDLGMSVSLTSGAGWSTANVPGLDPDSQQANQCVVLLTEELGAGCTRQGVLPACDKLREKASFVGAVAVRKAGERCYHPDGYVVLTNLIQDGMLTWTAPDEADYTIMYYFSQGTAQKASPAAEASYTINYFDGRGVEALKGYLEKNVLNDAALNRKIRAGNVQYFMDSLEYHCGAGITSWTETFEQEFRSRKGYDVLPYLFLTADAPNTSIWDWHDNADLQGTDTLTDPGMAKRILDDIFDVQTKLYMEKFIIPFRSWLNDQGITLRVQISYGKNLEISEPIAAVDHPEAENRNQKNQIEMYRLWTGGAHLQNKVLSAETGGLDNSNYNYTLQRHLQEAYTLYAAGMSRIIWHIWAAEYGPTPVWPGYEGGNGKEEFYKFGTREPSYSEYALFNDHLGRVQKFLRRGKAGVDLGMIYTKYGQHLAYGDAKDWMHTHQPMFFPSTNLQDHGYTYDYLSPALLQTEEVVFDRALHTLELAGYQALVLWQADLSVAGARRILSLASEGLPVVIVEGAAVVSPYESDRDEVLAELIVELKRLSNVRSVCCAEDVLGALRDLGIFPYVGFGSPNQQLLTRMRRDGRDRYVYVYNYCDGSLHNDTNAPHGDWISTELVVDGSFIPYAVDPWTGKTSSVAARYEKGKTIFPCGLSYGDVALYALEGVSEPPCADIEVPAVRVLEPCEITGWDLTVEAWTPSGEIAVRTETLLGVTTCEYAYQTAKNQIHTTLDRLATWDQIKAIGKTVSGKGFYRASFHWDAAADGTFLDFGRITQSLRVKINGRETDPVNLNCPRVDITDLLQPGENTIEVAYSSNLNNLQIARGKVKEHILVNNFPGYRTKYESYGLQKAAIVPYLRRKEEQLP